MCVTAQRASVRARVFAGLAPLLWPSFVMTLALSVSSGCTQSYEGSTPEPAPAKKQSQKTSQAPAAVEATAARTPDEETIDWDARVLELAKAHGDRQKCNDLNGCAMVKILQMLGNEAAPAIGRLYKKTGGDKHSRLQLLEVLGRIRSFESGPFLLDVARNDRLPPARAEALLALARLGRKEHLDNIRTLVDGLDTERDLPILLAGAYAMVVLGDERGRSLIVEHLVIPEETNRWDVLRPGVYAAGVLRMTELRERIEILVKRADPFVRREAVRALVAIRD
ncbi:MAG: HEAT repeat protein, partial [Myxococcota bacterium]